jgi:hypothetical protein
LQYSILIIKKLIYLPPTFFGLGAFDDDNADELLPPMDRTLPALDIGVACGVYIGFPELAILPNGVLLLIGVCCADLLPPATGVC